VKKSVGLAVDNSNIFLLADCFFTFSPKLQCFCPYSALDFFEFAKASPAKIRLDYERNHCIKNEGIYLVE
jgi:hypothetical protein